MAVEIMNSLPLVHTNGDYATTFCACHIFVINNNKQRNSHTDKILLHAYPKKIRFVIEYLTNIFNYINICYEFTLY